jgi:hypothetical protein
MRSFAVKAVLYQHGNNPGGQHKRIVLVEDANAVAQVVGEVVTIRQRGGDVVAAVRLGEKDYITWEKE